MLESEWRMNGESCSCLFGTLSCLCSSGRSFLHKARVDETGLLRHEVHTTLPVFFSFDFFLSLCFPFFVYFYLLVCWVVLKFTHWCNEGNEGERGRELEGTKPFFGGRITAHWGRQSTGWNTLAPSQRLYFVFGMAGHANSSCLKPAFKLFRNKFPTWRRNVYFHTS